MRILTYDVEIVHEVHDFPDTWEAAKRGECGVSSIVIHDSATERDHIYMCEIGYDPKKKIFTMVGPGQIPEAIEHLNYGDLLVGFNNYEFDKPCLENFTGLQITRQQYDILAAVWKSLGSRIKGHGLNTLCNSTLGIGKTGTGEHAPKLFKEGRFGELLDYNLNDVFLTRKLFNHIMEFGYVKRGKDRIAINPIFKDYRA